MRIKNILLLLKRSAFDVYVQRHQEAAITALHPTSGNLQDRHQVHEATLQKCKDFLASKGMVCRELYRDELQDPIRDVDLVVTVGGDGTLLQASHFLNTSIPVLGVNSDPTQMKEVEERHDDYDATRSVGYLCAATKDTFEHVLQEITNQKRKPSYLTRISAHVNGSLLRTFALNDILLAHPNPAAITRCTLRILKANNSGSVSPLVHTRCSGLRICTGIGSTAAMHSAGGFNMSPWSTDLQYMVREPNSPPAPYQHLMHHFVRQDELLQVKFTGRQGLLYFDGCHLNYKVGFEDVIEFSVQAPPLLVFLRDGM